MQDPVESTPRPAQTRGTDLLGVLMRALSAFLLSGLLGVAGCAPVPVTFYVGDSGVGRLSYNSCSLGAVPEGLVVGRGGVEVLADIRPRGDNEVVQLRFDIGPGHQ